MFSPWFLVKYPPWLLWSIHNVHCYQGSMFSPPWLIVKYPPWLLLSIQSVHCYQGSMLSQWLGRCVYQVTLFSWWFHLVGLRHFMFLPWLGRLRQLSFWCGMASMFFKHLVFTMYPSCLLGTHVSQGFLLCNILVLGYSIGLLGHLKVLVWLLLTNAFSMPFPLTTV